MKILGVRGKGFRVGLDIGTRIIKTLELSQDANKHRLTQFKLVKIGYPFNYEKTKEALATLFDKFHPSTKEVNISLSAPHAIVRFIDLPKMTGDELKKSISFEAEKYIPFNINEVVLDASVLESATEGRRDMRVLLAAAKKEIINARLELLNDFGISVSAIDIDSFACFNAFLNSVGNIDAARNIALLNIGYFQTNVIISSGNVPFFTRDIQIGSRDIAKEIAKELAIEENEADELLFEPKDKESQINEAAKSIFANLADELRLSFGYYENQYGKGVNEICVSGGMARFDGLSECLEENFGTKPAVWNPFATFEIDSGIDKKELEEAGHKFAVSAGLAIRH